MVTGGAVGFAAEGRVPARRQLADRADLVERCRGHSAQAGLGKWVKTDPPFQGETVLILDVKDEWDLYGESEGGPREEIDYDAEYLVKGDTVKVTHSTGSTTHRWSVDGDRLTLEWASTTQPAFNGVPDEVYQRALYMTAEFTKDDS